MSVKLSVTVRKALERKYAPPELARVDAALKAWIAADRARGVETVHLALDDGPAMRARGVSAVKGRVTAGKAKRAIDALWRKLAPDYLVLLGADDVVPHFVVENPSYGGADGDDDRTVRTDNPYASTQPFRASRLASYLLPDRVVGRIPDLPGGGDPAWLLAGLAVATGWRPQPARTYADVYAICCDEWRGAGEDCLRALGEPVGALLVSPPVIDRTARARTRLARRLHLVKCHGAKLDGRFFGQRGGAYPVALEGATAAGRVKAGAVAGAMCCYGAQVFSPADPAVVPAGATPLSIAYLQAGAFGFAGATEIAWVGVDAVACADVIVTRYLSAVRGGASQGRALLDAKQAYLRALQQAGREPGIEDEKTLLEFLLLGDPSIHPVASPAAPAPAAGPARRGPPALAAARPSAATAGERQRRRVFAAQLASQLRAALPTRRAAAAAPRSRAPALLRVVEQALGKAAKAMGIGRTPLRVDRVEPARLPAAPAIAGMRRRGPGAVPAARQATLQYYWTGKRVVDGHAEIRLVRVETDTSGKVLRHAVVRSG